MAAYLISNLLNSRSRRSQNTWLSSGSVGRAETVHILLHRYTYPAGAVHVMPLPPHHRNAEIDAICNSMPGLLAPCINPSPKPLICCKPFLFIFFGVPRLLVIIHLPTPPCGTIHCRCLAASIHSQPDRTSTCAPGKNLRNFPILRRNPQNSNYNAFRLQVDTLYIQKP